jgi:hypothetical protein
LYEIIFKVPKGVQGLSPNEVFFKIQKINPKVGEIYLENDYCLYFGLTQENDDISAFETLSQRLSHGQEEKCSLAIRMDSPWCNTCTTLLKEPEGALHEIEVFAIPLNKGTNLPFMRKVRKTSKIIV